MGKGIQNDMIVIYTSSNCVYCHKAKDYLKEKRVDFVERNIDEPQYREELITLSGQLGVPVINIKGDIIVGFSKKRIDELC